MRGLYSHSRECRKIVLRDHFPHISQILEGLHFGANTFCARIRTRANTGKNPGELFMYWFRARAYVFFVYQLFFSLKNHDADLTHLRMAHESVVDMTRQAPCTFWPEQIAYHLFLCRINILENYVPVT